MRKLIRSIVKRMRAQAQRKREARIQKAKAAYANRAIKYAADNPDKVKLVWLGDEPRLFDIRPHSNTKRYDDMRALFPSETEQAEHARIQRGGAVILPSIAKK